MKEYKYKINGSEYKVTVKEIEENIAQVVVNGVPYEVEMEKKEKPQVVKPIVRPAAPIASSAKPKPANNNKSVKSPLPGVILDIKVNVGDSVKKGQTVLILEAMKMENNINSDRDGVVKAINVSKGESVLEGADLIIIE